MARCFKREWSESRGDRHDDWGSSVWYFELDDDGAPKRQLEIYSSGDSLAYDREHPGDAYGGLADQPLDGDWTRFAISADEFETAWRSARLRNRV